MCVQIFLKVCFNWQKLLITNKKGKMSQNKKLYKALTFPLILLFILISFVAIYRIFNLPTNEELIKIVKIYFERFGYPVLFISAFIESLPGICLYFPGSSVVLLAAAFSRQGTLNIFSVILITAAALQLGFTINYFIGKHGWFKLLIKMGLGDTLNNNKAKIEKHGDKWIWFTYIHPNIGALTSTAYGILKMPFRKFLITSIFATLFWCTFWGIVCFLSSGVIEGIIKARWLLLTFAFGWIILQIIKAFMKTRTK
jgi:membrane protein DedA with SNARE-associated domain